MECYSVLVNSRHGCRDSKRPPRRRKRPGSMATITEMTMANDRIARGRFDVADDLPYNGHPFCGVYHVGGAERAARYFGDTLTPATWDGVPMRVEVSRCEVGRPCSYIINDGEAMEAYP